jgi:hypothetical protein
METFLLIKRVSGLYDDKDMENYVCIWIKSIAERTFEWVASLDRLNLGNYDQAARLPGGEALPKYLIQGLV